jgi:GNAT superfamily N-acetyltransferase
VKNGHIRALESPKRKDIPLNTPLNPGISVFLGMSHQPEYRIRRMTAGEITGIAVQWAMQQGWNPGLHDGNAFAQADANAFWVGLLNEQPIACLSVANYHNSIGFIGFYLVHPDHRHRGYGLRLWNHVLGTQEVKVLAGDGVMEQLENYQKSGFQFAWMNARYTMTHLKKPFNRCPNVRKYQTVAFKDLLTYDTKHFGIKRADYLCAWLEMPNSYPLVYLTEGQLKGLGIIRKCLNGWKIGPLFADTYDIATMLFNELSLHAEIGDTLFLDIPEANPYALQMVQSLGMKSVFKTARLYKGGIPALPLENIYGITSFEFG